MSPTVKQPVLKELILDHLDTDPGSLRFSRIATGKHNASFWVASDRGQFVLRIAPADDAGFLFYERLMMRQEPALHQIIRDNTAGRWADIGGHDCGRSRIDRDVLLMSALPGTPMSERPAMPAAHRRRVLRQVGGHLRRLHALTAPEILGQTSYGYLGAHQPMAPQATWSAAFHLMWNKLLDDVVACGAYSQEEGDALRHLLDSYMQLFERHVEARLLHMDVWSQNILVDDRGSVTGIVDFDRALWGDIEIEFAVLDYCGISEPAFWDGYGQQRDTSPEADIRRRFYLLYEIQKYMPIEIWRRGDPQRAATYKRRSFELAAPLFRAATRAT